jgi:hypothetical protein
MRKPTDPNDYELRDEYDFSKMTIVPKGRYAPHRRAGKNVVLLDPDVVQAFPNDESVNAALRLVMQMASIPSQRRGKGKHTARAKPRTKASARLVTEMPA